jgi:hypothetical protein
MRNGHQAGSEATGSHPQLFVFCYHKSGTQLFAKILTDLARHFGLVLARALGAVDHIDGAADIVLFSHSIIRCNLATRPHRGVRIVRDPRGIWVSGYWYHQRCDEHWCVNTDFDVTPPIGYPRVPYSQVHRSEGWKRDYLAGLDGRSYQANLLAVDRNAGLAFEEARYAAWTAEAMAAWLPDESTIDVKLESIAADFDAALATILRHFGFSGDRLADALRISQTHDVTRMSAQAIAQNPHITSRDVTLWRCHLAADRRRRFEERHRALITSLGYPM